MPESRVAALRSAIGRFVDGIDASPFMLTAEQITELRELQNRGAENAQHTTAQVQKFVKAVFAIYGEPIQTAFNEAPWPGSPGDAAALNHLRFGPPDASGLRVALLCTRQEFIFGDNARLDLRLWNTGTETLIVGIGRNGPGLFPKLDLQATHSDGRPVVVKTTAESQMLKDIKFAKTWQLPPGETADVFGYRLRVGPGSPREAEAYPDWYTVLKMTDVAHNDEVVLTGILPPLVSSGASSDPPELRTGNVRIKAVAPEMVDIWTAGGGGCWPMPGGVTLDVRCELFHGADVSTEVVLTWPKDPTGTTYAFNTHVAADAFANREPWLVVWERNSTSFWTMTGELGHRGPGLAKPSYVRRIDFKDKSSIVTTTWYHRPAEMSDGVRQAFEKVFLPLSKSPRRASEAEGTVQVSVEQKQEQ